MLLGIATAALALSLFSAWRSIIPPQTRLVATLQGRVEDLEFALADVRDRLTKRARAEGADESRDKLKRKRTVAEQALQEAAAVLEAAQTAGAQASPGPSLPDDPAVVKARLRSIHLRR
jgi:hypothetical protein